MKEPTAGLVSLASSLNQEVSDVGQSLKINFSVAEAKSFAASIVSETTGDMTCPVAYRDGRWIARGHSLSRNYIQRGHRAVRKQ